MGTPCSYAMKPRTEKMAKPATKLVPLLRQQSMMQSLRGSSERGWGQSGRNRYTARTFSLSTIAILWSRQGTVGTDSPICLLKPLWFREVRWLAHGHTASLPFLEDKVTMGQKRGRGMGRKKGWHVRKCTTEKIFGDKAMLLQIPGWRGNQGKQEKSDFLGTQS